MTRICGRIPDGYTGPIFYRVSNFLKPNPPSKVLFDYIKFLGRNTREVNEISYLNLRDAIVHSEYLDEHGRVREQWAKPIKAMTKANYREDWPEFSPNGMTLVSTRVKEAIEKYETENHAFVAIDVESPAGVRSFQAFVMVRGVQIDSVDYVASGIVPRKIYPGGKGAWDASVALPRDEFAYLKRHLVQGKHHYWDENVQNVWSQEIVAELGDILPKEFVFVPMGVTG